ncbi:exported hypothetical protein [Capnocytophaga canimorsus]|nr:exported hypothetical protein [Capnocytophaga canimorsus]
MIRKYLFVLTTCLIVACNTSKNQQQKTNEKPPNVIFIIADDIGYADFSCYGATAIQTPQVDKLSQEGFTLYQCSYYSGYVYPFPIFFILQGQITNLGDRKGYWNCHRRCRYGNSS